MDLYLHLVENIKNEIGIENKLLPDKKFYIPQDMKDIEKQKQYKEKRNKNNKQLTKYVKSHIIFQRPWTDLNKAQKMNRIISYANLSNLDKNELLSALEKRNIKEVNYDEINGNIVELILKE